MNSLFDPSKTIHFNLLSMYDPLSVLDSYFYINLLLQKFRNNFFLFLLLSRIFPLLHWPHLLLHMSQHILEILTFNCIWILTLNQKTILTYNHVRESIYKNWNLANWWLFIGWDEINILELRNFLNIIIFYMNSAIIFFIFKTFSHSN